MYQLRAVQLEKCPIHVVSTVCGKPTVAGKIFGGQSVVGERWPWQASLFYLGKHICGAVLMERYWVASAAHCFLKSHMPADYQVLLGYNQLQQPTQHSLQLTVNRIIIHPDFEKFHPMGSDIVMLQLHLPVNFTSHIVPACLPMPDTQFPTHGSCWITGWGMLSEDEFLPSPFHLQEGEVGILENEFCRNYFPPSTPNSRVYSVHEDMLCAGDLNTGKAVCRGDSGGPLVCQVNNSWFLLGLSSWSLDCRKPIYPSVFTRVPYFSSWIQEVERATPIPDPASAPPQGLYALWYNLLASSHAYIKPDKTKSNLKAF
ncbi:serine protease 40-like [Orycteropus afer afer]|uniref:Serine protease 40-like n=1 Tax=Orycteropus afer afer TaxID=1230840 RepID=A0A8B7ALL9_ORYAF|nr:serine protease 40-like [Orycteropus afer afer]